MEPIINESELVISHCGAGILLECLKSKKNKEKGKNNSIGTTNIGVINESLMNNHQTELGYQLHSEGYMLCTDTSKVLDEIENVLAVNS